MHSQLIEGLPFQTFGLCIAIGVLMAWKLAEHLWRDIEIGNLIFLLLISGLVGARLTHVIEFFKEDGFDVNPLSALKIWQGGLVFYGGLIAGAVSFTLWCLVKRRDFLKIADVLCVVIPLAHAFGRIGCFFHGCCWGKVSDSVFAVRFPAHSPVWAFRRASDFSTHSLPVLPTQLFEAAALLLLFAVLLLIYRRVRAYTAAVYMMGYSLIRFGIEFLRDDKRPEMFGLSSAQLVSLVLFCFGCLFMLWSYLKNGKSAHNNK